MSNETTYLLDDNSLADRGFRRELAPLRPRRLDGFDEIMKAARDARADDMWIVLHSRLAAEAVRAAAEVSKRLGLLLMLDLPAPDAITSLMGSFRRIVFSPSRKDFLPPGEMAEVLLSENKRNLFIGGTVDHRSRTVTLWRGDGTPLVVPQDTFLPSGDGTIPDFKKFSVADFGHTIKLGEYEASAESVLVENDPEYRRSLREKRRREERGFGPSLRRLRALKGLTQEDFAPLSSKTIARIEQGGTGKPRGKTLSTIEKRLGMPAERIETY